jgi:hypothetical protein
MRGGLWRVLAISALDEMAISAHACDELVYCAPTGVAGAAWVIKIHPACPLPRQLFSEAVAAATPRQHR